MASLDNRLTPEQIRQRRINRKGINLTILLIGENGIGKKTFMNTLCNSTVFEEDSYGLGGDLSIQTKSVTVTEPDSIPIQLRINYTVNFGLKLENSDNAEFINQFIEKEYKSILDEEVRINRNPRREDNRIHVALYFVKPTGKGLNEFDVQVLKKIGEKVNVIPLLAKSDTLTESEIELNKRLIFKSIQDNNIEIYNFEDDEDEFRLIKDRLPFGIIGSNQVRHGKHVRSYPWGEVVIEDSGCDFGLFKNILFGSHLQDFKDNTIHKKYEIYRSEMLSSRSNSRDIY